jgi:hypothetical protein
MYAIVFYIPVRTVFFLSAPVYFVLAFVRASVATHNISDRSILYIRQNIYVISWCGNPTDATSMFECGRRGNGSRSFWRAVTTTYSMYVHRCFGET